MKFILPVLFALATLSTHAGITIGAYNIRNFDYDARYHIRTNKVELSKMILDLNVDILSVEEIVNTAKWDEFVQTKLPGYDTEVSRCGGAHGQHLGFIFNKNKIDMLSFHEDISISDPGGNSGGCNAGSRPLGIALFEIKATKQKFFGMTAHLKSGSNASSMAKREKQYKVIKNVMNELTSKTGIKDFFFAGDLNTTEYLTRGNDYRQLTRIVSDLGMIDLASKLNCSAYWWGGSDDKIEDPSLLDHIVVSPGLIKTSNAAATVHGHCEKVNCQQASVNDLGISYDSVSDHCPITATIQ